MACMQFVSSHLSGKIKTGQFRCYAYTRLTRQPCSILMAGTLWPKVSSGRSLCFLCPRLPVTFIERGCLCSVSPLQTGGRRGCGFHLSQVCPCHSFSMGLPSELESLSETRSWPLMTLMWIPTEANELMRWDQSSFFFRSRPRRQPKIPTPEWDRLGKHLVWRWGHYQMEL